MKSKEFIGKFGVQKETPSGGSIIVSIGDIITEEDESLEGIAIQIKDKNKKIVTEFALQPETFGVLIELIQELYVNEVI